MRKLSYAVAASLLIVGLAGQAQAVVLDFTGLFSLKVSALDPAGIPGAGSALVNGSDGAGHLVALQLDPGLFATAGLIVPVTDPAAFPIAGIQATAANGAGAFSSDDDGTFGGVMPINGVAKVCLFGPCTAAVSNLAVPLSVVGAGGAAFVQGAVNITVIGAPWTTGTAFIGNASQFDPGERTLMGGVSPQSNTGAPSGTVTLVTPVFISTNIGASAVLPAFGVLTLHFVPEPGTLMLLGSGIVGLVALGRSRVR